MGIERLCTAFVGDVPDAKGLVVGGGKQELPSWVHQERSHPIVVTGQREKANTYEERG